MLRTYGYIRYSDHHQDFGFSIEYQTTELEQYAEKNGLNLVKLMIDQAQTATKVAGREQFFALMDEVKKGNVDCILVYKMNRIFRNSLESQKYRKMLNELGVKIMSATQYVDEETSTGRLTTSILADIDQYQSETISDHVKSSMREMARQGYYTGGVVRYGFKLESIKHGTKVRKKFVIDEERAVHVRTMFQMYADGFSLFDIAKHFRENQIYSLKGTVFCCATIARMLKSDQYIGTYRFKTKGYDPIVVENCFPSIVDKKTWDKVQLRKNGNTGFSSRRSGESKTPNPLSGLIFCKKCGSHYTKYKSGVAKNRKWDRPIDYYRCQARQRHRTCKSRSIQQVVADNLVLNEIKKHILNDITIDSIAQGVVELYQESPSNLSAKLKELKKQRTANEKKLNNLIDLVVDGSIDKEKFNSKSAPLNEIKIDLDMLIMNLEEQLENEVTFDGVKDYLTDMLRKAENSSAETLRTIFETFVEKIELDENSMDIYLKVHPRQYSANKDTNRPPCVSLFAKVKRTDLIN